MSISIYIVFPLIVKSLESLGHEFYFGKMKLSLQTYI